MVKLNQITLPSDLIQKKVFRKVQLKALLLGDGTKIQSDDNDDDDDDDDNGDEMLPPL